MLTARQCHALVAQVTVEAELATALARSTTVALQGIAAFPADRHVAEVTSPSFKEKIKKNSPTLFINKQLFLKK